MLTNFDFVEMLYIFCWIVQKNLNFQYRKKNVSIIMCLQNCRLNIVQKKSRNFFLIEKNFSKSMLFVWKKQKMFFFLNFFTFATMNHFWLFLFEFSKLLMIRFFVKVAIDANVVDNCAQMIDFRWRVCSRVMILLNFCVYDFFSFSNFESCFSQISFVDVVFCSFDLLTFCFVNFFLYFFFAFS